MASHYLDFEQLTQLRKLVEGNVTERVIIELLYATGVRLGELVSIQKEDIIWSERIIHIRKGKGKKERIVLFTKGCEVWMKAYLESRFDQLPYLLVNKRGKRVFCRRTIQRNFTVYSEQLEVRLTPHTLRHTFAAHLAIKGMAIPYIQALMGHDDPNQTHQYARLFAHARKLKYDEWM